MSKELMKNIGYQLVRAINVSGECARPIVRWSIDIITVWLAFTTLVAFFMFQTEPGLIVNAEIMVQFAHIAQPLTVVYVLARMALILSRNVSFKKKSLPEPDSK